MSAAVLLLVLFWPAVVRAAEAPRVNAIEVQGLRRIEEGAVRQRIAQRLGEPLSSETVSADIKAVYGMGYFANVKAEVEPFEGGVRLIYIVKEKPSIKSVKVYGNKKVADSRLTEKLTISPGALADPVLIQENADILLSVYEEKGYPLAVVVPVLMEAEDGGALLTYKIKEGPKVMVKEIVIKGNREMPAESIKNAMKTSEWWILSWLTSGGRYEKAEMASDVERIRELYHNNGFMKAEVSEPRIELSRDRKRMSVTINVREGDRFTVSSVGFEGSTTYSDEELMRSVRTAPGATVSRKTLGEDVAALTGMYTGKGYALASVYPDILPDDKKKEARVLFRFQEDEVYRVGRMEISGNLKTRDRVIRREMRINEGDLFDSNLLRRSHERLANLNFFDEIRFNPVPDARKRTIDLDINVTERSTGFLNIGGGYSTIDKLMGMVDLTLGNLGGRGQYLKVKSEFSSKSTLYELAFREPWLFGRHVSLDSGIYRTERDYSGYKKKANGLSLGLGMRFQEYWRSGISYRYEQATIFDIDELASIIIKEQAGTRATSSISPSLARDTRDNYLDPYRGSMNSIYLTYAGLGGDNRFIKGMLTSSWYLPVTEKTTFSLRGRYGYATGLEGEDLPLYERFYVGGPNTLRGLRDIGEHTSDGSYIGGRQRLIFNLDYIFPLVSEMRLKGNFFYDIGSAYDPIALAMRNTAGVGVRWISPIGPIKIEWAYNLAPEENEGKYRWEFSIGTFF